MKIAPLLEEMKNHSEIEAFLIHTGQHYDDKMSQTFFDDLGLPKPNIYLGVGSGNHGVQTGKIMMELEPILQEIKPDLMVVVGDVNSTLAAALVAAKLGIKIAHVEAGLRSYDWEMPEEINRVVVDRISDYLFITEKEAQDNLIKEGVDKEKIFFSGNVMIDTLLKHKERAEDSHILEELSLSSGRYGVVTLHRPSNVEDENVLGKIVDALLKVQDHIQLVFPVHPRTNKQLEQFGLKEKLLQSGNIKITEPLGYLEFLKLTKHAGFVLTDSGGIQEETTALQVPCITMRENTERPVTSRIGSNKIIGNSPERIYEECLEVISGKVRKGMIPEQWDGKAAQRIVKVLLGKMQEKTV